MKSKLSTGAPMAVVASEAARMLGISDVHFRKLKRTELMGPRPVQLGLGNDDTSERGERWNVAELTAWLNSGCPPRPVWQTLKANRLPELVTFRELSSMNADSGDPMPGFP